MGGALDTDNSLLLADTNNHVIRRVSPLGVTSLVAGSGNPAFADGWGGASSNGIFTAPTGVSGSNNRGALFAQEVGYVRAMTPWNSSISPFFSTQSTLFPGGTTTRNLAFDDSAAGSALATPPSSGPLAGVRASFMSPVSRG